MSDAKREAKLRELGEVMVTSRNCKLETNGLTADSGRDP